MILALLGGWLAGMVHVWSGPDHLTAIAPLAVRRPRRAWVPGVRWGFGHSAGVALVGLLSLWLRDLLPVDLLSSWGERLVGVMLFGIGLWGLRKAFSKQIHSHEHRHNGETHVHIHVHSHTISHERSEAHRHSHAAFGIGILHGLAGSSHFLGVLPILAFPKLAQAVAYLAGFGFGTVVSMALFSSFIGILTERYAIGSDRAYRRMMSVCSLAAIGVGSFWLLTSFRRFAGGPSGSLQ
jgi:ABC-type nickel/cobalt efflux system permease component RcnA